MSVISAATGGAAIPSGPSTNSQITSKEATFPSLLNTEQEVAKVSKKSLSSENTILAKNITRALGMLAGMGLGVLAGLAVVGIMATPAGWAVLGGVAVLSLAAAFYLGGLKELTLVLAGTAAGFITAFPTAISTGVGALTGAYVIFTFLSLYSICAIGVPAVGLFVIESHITNEEEKETIEAQPNLPPPFNPES